MARIGFLFVGILSSLTSSTVASFPAPALRSDIGPGRSGVDHDLECGLRSLSYDFATFLQPQGDNALVFDALRLGADCNMSRPSNPSKKIQVHTSRATSSATYYVDAATGNDGNSGTEASPFQSITRALQATRMVTPASSAEIVLRDSAVFFLAAPIVLGPQDNQLSISSYPNEEPVLSGGIPLSGLSWQQIAPGPAGGMSGPFEGVSVVSNTPGLTPGGNVSGVIQYGGSFVNVAGCASACESSSLCSSYTWHDSSVTSGWANECFFRIDGTYEPTSPWPDHFSGAKVTGVDASIWRATLPSGTARFDNIFSAERNRRLTRAKSPNGSPEVTIDGFAGGAKSWAPPHSFPAPQNINIPSPARNDDPFFPTYQLGKDGTCAQFDPPSGFWCSTNPPAGSQYNVPSGVTLPPGLLGNNFSGVGPGTIFHAFHGDRWADWKFLVEEANADSGLISWSYGGFQDARGWSSGDTFMMEGMLSFLDYFDEWFLDESVSPMQLYVMFNNSNPPSTSTSFITTSIDSLLRLNGTAAAPVVGVTISGLTFSHTAPTFMKPFASASGGDYSLRVDATLFVTGTENLSVSNCNFNGVGGNALLLYAYNRGAKVTYNSFRFVGDSAIVSLGVVNGIDGRDQNVPIGTQVTDNMASELGIYVKQSGFYYHAQSANATVSRNIFFNTPRAGININDGYGGGHVVDQNLCFNAVRETSDHGCFNSWDRQPYQWDISRPDYLYPSPSSITRNLFVSNYHRYVTNS